MNSFNIGDRVYAICPAGARRPGTITNITTAGRIKVRLDFWIWRALPDWSLHPRKVEPIA